MRFRFCGDLDCPDWILAEVAVLSRISSVRLKLLAKQVVGQLLGGGMDYEKVAKLTSESLTGGSSELKAAIAALHFILASAAKYGVDEGTLCLELAQLGLPRENCEAVSRPFRASYDSLRTQFEADTLRLAALRDVAWRVDTVIASSDLGDVSAPAVQLNLTVDVAPHAAAPAPAGAADPPAGDLRDVAFEVPADKFRALYAELRTARALMESVE